MILVNFIDTEVVVVKVDTQTCPLGSGRMVPKVVCPPFLFATKKIK